jgi:hypothetical protein
MALTPEHRREQALREVHQHRPDGLHAVVTIEATHSRFDQPLRIVADNEDLTAALETGEIVEFQAVAFRSIGPAQGESRWPEVELTIDGASDIIEPYLDQATAIDEPVIVTVREYVRHYALQGPGRVIEGLELDKSTAGDLQVTGTAGFYGLDKKFGRIYDPSKFPGLG